MSKLGEQLYELMVEWNGMSLAEIDAQPGGMCEFIAERLHALQPAPEVQAGAEVAEVLGELLDKIEEMQHTDWAINCDGPLFKRARAALKAATRARDAGGEQVEPMTITVTSDPSAPPPNVWVMGRELRQAEAIERAARAASIAWENADDGPDEWPSVARAVLAAAPPAPSAHGVAELLAELDARDERQGMPGLACIPVAEVRRLLAPSGADGAEGDRG